MGHTRIPVPHIGTSGKFPLADFAPSQFPVTLAPVVADDCQNTGVAGTAFPSVVTEARATGRTHLVLMGGTQERNARAVRFYLREGFISHGRFEHPPGIWNIGMTRVV